MLHKLLGVACVSSLLIAAPLAAASAADMPVKAPPPPPPAPVYTWTGFYVGGNIGYSWGRGDSTYNEPAFACCGLSTTISQSQRLDGVIGGPQIGYNWQVDRTWVVGLEADFQWSGERGSSGDCIAPCGLVVSNTFNSSIDWFGTVRGRAGFLVTPTMWMYGTGGLAYGRISASGAFYVGGSLGWSFADSTTTAGWTAGAGLEGAVFNSRDWTWKIEYLYVDFGSVGGSGYDSYFGGPYSWSTRVTDNVLRFGLNYQFH